MSSKYPHSKYPFIRFYIGDVRDSERILSASEGIENIIHAAALKQVPSTEYNPFEAVQTNIIGFTNHVMLCTFDKTSLKKLGKQPP